MGAKLLKEVCESIGVTRRAVQGYESIGLVAPTGRNKMGYLLYDDSAQNKIKHIKQFQDMGFSLKEIKELENASPAEIKKALEEKVIKIRKEIEKIAENIRIAEDMLKNL